MSWEASNTLPQCWEAQLEAGFIGASNAVPQYCIRRAFEASLKPASTGLQTRFPNTGTEFEADGTRDIKILKRRVSMRNRAGSAGHCNAVGRILVRGLPQVCEFEALCVCVFAVRKRPISRQSRIGAKPPAGPTNKIGAKPPGRVNNSTGA